MVLRALIISLLAYSRFSSESLLALVAGHSPLCRRGIYSIETSIYPGISLEDNSPLKVEVPDLVPASILAEFAYCPRRCYISWAEGEFVDCAETADGRFQHRRMETEAMKHPEEDLSPIYRREVTMTGPMAGLTCRIDLLLGDGRYVIPVDYKRGYAPDIPEGAYEPDRIQLCAQGMVLRENGFRCDSGAVYFLKSKKKVSVKFDEQLIQRTKDLLGELRALAIGGKMPPPLQDSPKCNRCSMGGICLPDEINLLRGGEVEASPDKEVRRLLPSSDNQIPVYVVKQGCTIRKCGDRLEVWSKEGKIDDLRLLEVSEVSIYGGVEITTPAIVELMQRGVSVLHYTHGGWFLGICHGTTHKNVELRIKQFDWARDPDRSLFLARSMIAAKIKNSRTMLRRNDPEAPEDLLDSLANLALEAETALSMESLRGIEGAAAAAYFSRFGSLIKSAEGFSFQNRNKRPPLDPVNAVLSYLYGILVKELFVTLLKVGYDPYLGFYHQPRYGRPGLALDMMEEFRPAVADSVAVRLFNNRELQKKDFIRSGIGIAIAPDAKRKVIGGYEQRIQTEIAHPLFGYKISYRRVLEVQARLLARVLSGELSEYPAFYRR